MKTCYRIVETGRGGVPETVDKDGYETRLAAEEMVNEFCGEGCVVEAYEVRSVWHHVVVNGRVVSRHRTREAAERAVGKLQRATKRANGQSSYVIARIDTEVQS